MSQALLRVIVRARTDLAERIVLLRLGAAEGGALPPFSPGAHIDLHLASGLVRQYSLCGDAQALAGEYEIAVLLEERSRGGSLAVHRDLQPGMTLDIGAPRNAFALQDATGPVTLMAAGIGITPLLPMVLELQRRGADFHLHYCVRSRTRAAFLDRLQQCLPGERMAVHVATEGERFDVERDVPTPVPGGSLYLCGPSRFMTAVQERAGVLGWDGSAIHSEAFTLAAAPAEAGGSFKVEAAASGVTVEVGPEQSIAAALEAAGVDVLTSCEQGICGACLTPVIAGQPEHRDRYQTDAEKAANTHITICCSRSRGPLLVLDI